jgi:long-chain fatty acid transport protein
MEAAQASISMSADVAAANPWGYPAGTYTLPISGKIAVKNFQWPETYGLGLAYQATDKLMVAADYKRIGWKSVMKDFKMTFTADNSAGNQALGFANTVLDATLYQNWDDQDVVSLGLAYKTTDALTLRAGLNLANNPIPDKYENPLFPATEKNHLTLGAGYMFNKVASVDFSYTHAAKVTVTNGQGVETSHSQDSWQLMYSHRF